MAGNIDIVVNQVTANSYVGGTFVGDSFTGEIITGIQPLITSLPGLTTVTTAEDFNVGKDLNVVENIVVQNGSLTMLHPNLGNIFTNANIVASEQIYAGSNLVAQIAVIGSMGIFEGGVSATTLSADNWTWSNGAPFTGNVSDATIAGQINSILPTYHGPLTPSSVTTPTISAGNIQTSGTVQANNISVSNVAAIGGNLHVAQNIFATGNITAPYYYGNLAFATGIPPANTTYNDSNVAALLASGTLTTDITTTANISGSYILGNGAFLTGVSGGGNYGDANVAVYLPTDPTIIAIEGNIANTDALLANVVIAQINDEANIVALQSGLANTDANVANLVTITTNTDANVLALQNQVYGNSNVSTYLSSGTETANIITSGNVSGNYFLGNVAFATGFPISSSYGNANVAAYLPTYSGNVTSINMPYAVTNAYPNGAIVNNGGTLYRSNSAIAANVPFAVGSTANTWSMVKQWTKTAEAWYVDPLAGLDTNDGSIVSPFKTIAKAAATVGGSGYAVVLLPGDYNETITWNDPNINIQAVGLGSSVRITGTFTVDLTGNPAASVRITGVRFTDLVAVGPTNLYCDTCIIDKFTHNGTGYVEFTDCDAENGVVAINGTGTFTHLQGNLNNVVVANPSTIVTVQDTIFTAANVVVTAGTVLIDNAIMVAPTPTSNVVTSSAGTAVYVSYTGMNTTTGGLARVRLAGYYSFTATVMDLVNSTITGINLGLPNYSDALVALNSVTAVGGNVTGANFNTAGKVTAAGNIQGSFFLGNGRFLTGLTSTSISNGTSNISIPVANGNIQFSVAGSNIGSLSTLGTIAFGYLAGQNAIGANAVAIGYNAGGDGQASNGVAIGTLAGNASQGSSTVAIGQQAGQTTQGSNGVAIGNGSGQNTQGSGAVAVGALAGSSSQSASAVAMGIAAGQTSQGASAIAIGNGAGKNAQGANAIAIGTSSGNTSQAARTIIINASGTELNGTVAQTDSFYVNPVRNDTANVSSALFYNTATKEVTYGPAGSGTTYGNANVSTYLASGTDTANIITTGNISGSYILGNGAFLTGIAVASTYGNSNVTTLLSDGSVSSNIATTANVSGAYFLGNVAFASGLPPTITNTNQLVNGNGFITSATANVISVNGQTGNVVLSTYTNANVAAYLPTNTASIGANNITTTGAITVGSFGPQEQLIFYSTTPTTVTLDTMNSPAPFAAGQTMQITGIDPGGPVELNGYWTVVSADFTSVTIACTLQPTLPFTSVVYGRVVNLKGVTATGDVSGRYIIGDGSQLTNLPPGNYNNSNVTALLSAGITSNVITTGNITSSYFFGDGSQLSNIPLGTGISNGTSNITIPVADDAVTFAVAGQKAGSISINGVAIGTLAGIINQGQNTVAIGFGAGGNAQTQRAVAIGQNAGNIIQGFAAVAVGRGAGQNTQGGDAVAIGASAGASIQGASAVAIGASAATTSQGTFAVAVGPAAGGSSQGTNAIAIGRSAGAAQQGAGAIAIGRSAGSGGLIPQPAGSIAIIASGVDNNPENVGFYVDPVRNDTGNVTNVMYFNTSTKELTYGPAAGGSYGNAEVSNYLASGTDTANIITTGNISGAYFLGNVAFASGLPAAYGNAEVTTLLTDGTYGGNISMGGTIQGDAVGDPVNFKNYHETVSAVGSATGTITPDSSNGTIQSFTLTGNITLNAFANPVAGQNITMILTQDATGGRTLTSTMKFLGGVKTLSTAPNAVDILSVFFDGTNYWATLGKGYA